MFIFVSIHSFSQERFWGIYPGWKVDKSYMQLDNYLLCGIDTLDMGYSNTPIFSTINSNGDILETSRYVSDTLVGFSMYTSNSYSLHSSFVLASGVYKEYLKDYILNPILMYFNTNNYYLDSIKDFKTYFGGKSAQIIFHNDLDTVIHLFGKVQYTQQWNTRTFYGSYNKLQDSFIWNDYLKPVTCVMKPYQALPTLDGGYLVSCEQDMSVGNPEEVFACILKLDSEGNEQWRYVINERMVETQFGPAESATYRPRIFDAPDGNYWVVWTDPSYIMSVSMQINPNRTVWIAKLIDNGDSCEFIEERDLRAELDNFNRGSYVIEDSYQAEDGTMYVLLTMLSEYQSALAKIHPNGVGAWFRTYKCYPEDVGSSYTYLKGMTATSDGGFMLTGGYQNHGTEMFPDGMIASVVFKVDSCGCFEAEGCNDHCMDSYSEHFVYMQEASIFPNPASDIISVSFDYQGGETDFEYRIYSLNGQTLMSGLSDKEAEALEVSINDLSAGYYTIQVWGGGKIYTGKFVKE